VRSWSKDWKPNNL